MIKKIVVAALCSAAMAFGQAVGGGGVPGAGGGGGGTPCTGVVNGIQYNNAGAFGCNAALVFNPATGVVTASGYATGAATQGYLALTQNATAAPAAPANTFRFLAPQSGLTSSYDVLVPLLAPTANNSVMLVPSGGGQSAWGVTPTLGANTFTANQTVNIVAGGTGSHIVSGASVACYEPDSSGTAGGGDWTLCAGDTVFGAGSLYFNDSTGAVGVVAAINSRGFEVRAAQGFYFDNSSFDPTLTPDLGLSRCAAGVLCVGVGSASNSQGVVAANAFEAAGNVFSVTGCGTATSLVGGGTAGKFVGGSATCTPVVTMGSFTANHGFACHMSDFTTPTALFQESATTTTTATFTAAGTVGATDTIVFECLAY